MTRRDIALFNHSSIPSLSRTSAMPQFHQRQTLFHRPGYAGWRAALIAGLELPLATTIASFSAPPRAASPDQVGR